MRRWSRCAAPGCCGEPPSRLRLRARGSPGSAPATPRLRASRFRAPNSGATDCAPSATRVRDPSAARCSAPPPKAGARCRPPPLGAKKATPRWTGKQANGAQELSGSSSENAAFSLCSSVPLGSAEEHRGSGAKSRLEFWRGTAGRERGRRPPSDWLAALVSPPRPSDTCQAASRHPGFKCKTVRVGSVFR